MSFILNDWDRDRVEHVDEDEQYKISNLIDYYNDEWIYNDDHYNEILCLFHYLDNMYPYLFNNKSINFIDFIIYRKIINKKLLKEEIYKIKQDNNYNKWFNEYKDLFQDIHYIINRHVKVKLTDIIVYLNDQRI